MAQEHHSIYPHGEYNGPINGHFPLATALTHTYVLFWLYTGYANGLDYTALRQHNGELAHHGVLADTSGKHVW